MVRFVDGTRTRTRTKRKARGAMAEATVGAAGGAGLGLDAGRLRPWLLPAAALAAVLGWLAAEAIFPNFKEGDMTGAEAITNAAYRNRASATYGAQGAIFGLVAGLATGLATGRKGAGLVGGVIGMVIGGGLGALSPMGMSRFYLANRIVNEEDQAGGLEILIPMLTHAGMWIPIGLGAGLAVGWSGRGSQPLKAVLGGALGAALGAVIYDVAGGLLMATDGIEKLVADTKPARMLAAGSICLFSAVLIVGFLNDGPAAEKAGDGSEGGSGSEPASASGSGSEGGGGGGDGTGAEGDRPAAGAGG